MKQKTYLNKIYNYIITDCKINAILNNNVLIYFDTSLDNYNVFHLLQYINSHGYALITNNYDFVKHYFIISETITFGDLKHKIYHVLLQSQITSHDNYIQCKFYPNYDQLQKLKNYYSIKQIYKLRHQTHFSTYIIAKLLKILNVEFKEVFE